MRKFLAVTNGNETKIPNLNIKLENYRSPKKWIKWTV